jgi:Fe-S cluster assembly protein SufB
LIRSEYPHGFVTDVRSDILPRGISEDVIRLISEKKNEPDFMLEWHLAAFRHWLTMSEPQWATVEHPPIDYQDIAYYSSPIGSKNRSKSLEDIDP